MKKAWKLLETLLIAVIMLTLLPQTAVAAKGQTEQRTDNYLRKVRQKAS